jgi:hypothetical protein
MALSRHVYVIVRVAETEADSAVAVIFAEVVALTLAVFTVNVAEVFPAGILTDAGTVASDESLDSEIVIPPAGAGPLSVTVPVELFPPVTLVGLRESEISTVGSMVSSTFSVTPLADPVIVAVVATETGAVLMANVAELLPLGTTTFVGGVTAPLLLESSTGNPPAGAAPLSVTVPVEVAPPPTEAGSTLKPVRAGGVTVIEADADVVATLPEIVTTF